MPAVYHPSHASTGIHCGALRDALRDRCLQFDGMRPLFTCGARLLAVGGVCSSAELALPLKPARKTPLSSGELYYNAKMIRYLGSIP